MVIEQEGVHRPAKDKRERRTGQRRRGGVVFALGTGKTRSTVKPTLKLEGRAKSTEVVAVVPIREDR